MEMFPENVVKSEEYPLEIVECWLRPRHFVVVGVGWNADAGAI